MNRQTYLYLFAAFCWCASGTGCKRNPGTPIRPRIDQPPKSVAGTGAAPDKAPRLRIVATAAYYGQLLATAEEIAGPLTLEGPFLKGPRGPLMLDATEIEDDKTLDEVLTRAIEKNVRNYILTARQLCRPPEGDFVSHCAPEMMARISQAGRDGIFLKLKEIEFPFFPDLTALGPGLHVDLDSDRNNPGIPELMLTRLENAANVVSLSLPLTEEVQAQTKSLATLVQLEGLTLIITPSYKGDFAFLKPLRNLRRLTVSRLSSEEVAVAPSAFEALAAVPALEELRLDLPSLDASMVSVLSRCKTLKSLFLSLEQAPEGLLRAISALPLLERLGLEFQDELPSGFDLAGLATVKNLRDLHLSALEITENLLAPVFSMTGLTGLSLDFGTWPDSFDVKKLAVLIHLEHLRLDRLEFDVPLVLGAMKSLKSIEFRLFPEMCQRYLKAKAAYPKILFRVEAPEQCE